MRSVNSFGGKIVGKLIRYRRRPGAGIPDPSFFLRPIRCHVCNSCVHKGTRQTKDFRIRERRRKRSGETGRRNSGTLFTSSRTFLGIKYPGHVCPRGRKLARAPGLLSNSPLSLSLSLCHFFPSSSVGGRKKEKQKNSKLSPNHTRGYCEAATVRNLLEYSRRRFPVRFSRVSSPAPAAPAESQ